MTKWILKFHEFFKYTKKYASPASQSIPNILACVWMNDEHA